MTTRKISALKKLKDVLRVCLCVLCSVALALTFTSQYALASQIESPDSISGDFAYEDTSEPQSNLKDFERSESKSYEVTDSNGGTIRDLQHHYLDDDNVGKTFSLMTSEEEDISVKLKDSNEVKWFDRVEFPQDGTVNWTEISEHFYNVLIEASDNDGYHDYLIDDIYVSRSLGSHNINSVNVQKEYEKFSEGYSVIEIGKFSYDSDYDYYTKKKVMDDCTLVVMAAFDRDHPEVFWLNSNILTFYSVTKDTATKYLLIGGIQVLDPYNDRDDIRSIPFESENLIKSAIQRRELRTQELLSKVGVTYPSIQETDDANEPDASNTDHEEYADAEKVRFFNKWLTHSNGYNNQNLYSLSSSYPLAFECFSALVGRYGEFGPVCEGYSRALKVLCDAAGIPCVITDGQGDGGDHMWNYICIDDKWYATDVTWNDPGLAAVAISGRESESYLLVGSSTKDPAYSAAVTFNDTHIVENVHFEGSLQFLNGPVLEEDAYVFGDDANSFNSFDSSDYSVIDVSDLDSVQDSGSGSDPVPDSGSSQEPESGPSSDYDLAKAVVSGISSWGYTYTTKAITPVPTSVRVGSNYLRKDRDYKIQYGNNVNVGKAYLKLVAMGSYTGSKTVTFDIKPATVNLGWVSSVKDMVYTGKYLTPVPDVAVTNSAFVKGRDYTVSFSYRNNKNAGLASVVITLVGIGNCQGTQVREINFMIYPKKATLGKLTAKKKALIAKWSKGASSWCSGYQVRCSTSSKFKTGVKTSIVKSRTTSKITFKKLQKKKRYYVSIRAYKIVQGVKYFGAWSSTKSIRTK